MQHTTTTPGLNHPAMECIDGMFDEAERVLLSDDVLDKTPALNMLRLATATLRQRTGACLGRQGELNEYQALVVLNAAY